jgi:PKD repeat protein
VGRTLQIPYDEGRQALTFTAFVPELPPTTGGPLTPLNGTRWWLVSIGAQAVLPGSQATAEFTAAADGQTGTVTGNASCNTYNAALSAIFKVGSATMTKKFCPEPAGLMNQEYLYMSALQSAVSFTLVQNQLIVNTAKGPLVFYNSPAPLQPIAPPDLPPAEPEEPPVLAPTEGPTPEPTVEVMPTVEVLPTAQPTVEPTKDAPAAPPAAVISAPAEGVAGQAVQFDAGSSTSAGSITEYAWDFGDGSSAKGAKAEHAFAKPGTYTVTLTITDSSGKTATATHTITIK